MKYLTLDWWLLCQDFSTDAEEIKRPARDYRQYLDSIRDQLPAQLLSFQATFTLHDATLLRAKSDQRSSRFTMELLASKLTETSSEERQVRLEYLDIESVEVISDLMKSLPGPSGFGDLGYDELEVVGEDLIEHRLLFSTGIEWRIRFGGFRFALF